MIEILWDAAAVLGIWLTGSVIAALGYIWVRRHDRAAGQRAENKADYQAETDRLIRERDE